MAAEGTANSFCVKWDGTMAYVECFAHFVKIPPVAVRYKPGHCNEQLKVDTALLRCAYSGGVDKNSVILDDVVHVFKTAPRHVRKYLVPLFIYPGTECDVRIEIFVSISAGSLQSTPRQNDGFKFKVFCHLLINNVSVRIGLIDQYSLPGMIETPKSLCAFS